MAKKKNSEPFGAYKRICWLCDVFTDSGLQTPTVAVFAADLIKHTNRQTGKAYISMMRIAKEYGMTREALSRAVKRLLEAQKIEAVLRPGRPTLYKLRLPVTVQSQQEPVIIQSQVLNEPVIVQSHPSDCTITTPVIVQSHEPVINRGTKPRLITDSGEPATGCTPSPSADRGKAGDRFPAFWKSFPVRSTVSEAEAIISGLVESDIDLAEIVRGAKRYGDYSRATGGKRRQSAKAWLVKQGWRDDWTLPAKKSKAPDPRKLRKEIEAAQEIGETKERNAALVKVCDVIEANIKQHVWPDGEPAGWDKDDESFSLAATTAQCIPCAEWLFGGYDQDPCDAMCELAGLCDEANYLVESTDA